LAGRLSPTRTYNVLEVLRYDVSGTVRRLALEPLRMSAVSRSTSVQVWLSVLTWTRNWLSISIFTAAVAASAGRANRYVKVAVPSA
jgi:hypothetical protein